MKPFAHLEDFGTPKQPDPPEPTIDADALRSSYEAGYAAGQTNGVVTAEADKAMKIADIGQALQEAGFTYFEARQHVMNSMRPLLNAALDVVLPNIAKSGLSHLAIDEVLRIADTIDVPIEIFCAPDRIAELSDLVAAHVTFPLDIKGSDALTEMQIELRYDKGTSRIDIDQTIAKIRRATDNFFTTTKQEKTQNG